MKTKKQPYPAAPGSSGGQNSEAAAIKATRVPKEDAAVNKEKQPRGFSRKILLTVCTGVLALAFSAIPALALWLDDAQLLAQPHERTRQAGALELTSDDLYLTRILKKSSQRDASNYGYFGLTYPDNMSWSSISSVQSYLDELYETGVLPEEWWRYCTDHIEQAFVSSDRLGFTYYVAYAADAASTNSDFCYTVGITVENESQKVIAVWAGVPLELAFSPPREQTVLEAYRAYLGLEEFEGWEDPVDTWFAGSALYSPRAEVMLFCETDTYQSQAYSGPYVAGENRTDRYYYRSYYCLSAFSVPEATVRSWQEYTRSFPEGTDVWHRGGAPGNGQTEMDTWEEPLG